MSDRFGNLYRIQSTRLQNWDYSWSGSYFITICTRNRHPYFGKVVNGKMLLSEIGTIAEACWLEIKDHVKRVELGEFIVMPNHLHGILVLHRDRTVETRHALSLQPPANPKGQNKTIGQQRFQNQGKKSVSSIVGSYKSAVSKRVRNSGLDFAWQPRFYDQIIRDEKSLRAISNYIKCNPSNWIFDELYK